MGGHGGGTIGPRSCCPLVAGGLPSRSLGAVAGGGILEMGVGCGGAVGSPPVPTGRTAAATAAAAAAATAAFDLSEALVGGMYPLVNLSDRG